MPGSLLVVCLLFFGDYHLVVRKSIDEHNTHNTSFETGTITQCSKDRGFHLDVANAFVVYRFKVSVLVLFSVCTESAIQSCLPFER